MILIKSKDTTYNIEPVDLITVSATEDCEMGFREATFQTMLKLPLFLGDRVEIEILDVGLPESKMRLASFGNIRGCYIYTFKEAHDA